METKHTAEKLWTSPFIVLTLCNLLLFMNLQMVLPALPSYVKGVFHASDVMASLVTTLFALSAIITRLIAGKALQRGKRNLVLFLGLSVALLATLGYAWCGTLAMFLLMRVFYGAGFGMASTTFPTMTSNVVPLKRMGEGMGYYGLSTSLAMSLGPSIGLSLLASGFGSLVTGATVMLALILPMLFLVRSQLRQPAEVAPATPESSKLFDRKILLPFLLNFLLSIVYGGLLSFMALFGKEVGIANVGVFFLVNAVSVVLVRPLSGKIFDKKGHGVLMLPGALLVIAGLLIVSYSTGLGMLAAAALLFGAGLGILQPSFQAWMIKVVTPEQRGMANGMYFNSIDLGVALGALLLGTIAMNTGYAMMYRLATLVMVVFILLYTASQISRKKTSLRTS
ncbi:MFS transporter [Tumebacillus sp. ITR2]|uniref:MFS transporter n=1 Tax=Tumebacillus amylolyticus TaxID=2801339 RepID=A0ABS1J680_9BACL|nr:MFS transporter [Tumebacillus amylolyticus]